MTCSVGAAFIAALLFLSIFVQAFSSGVARADFTATGATITAPTGANATTLAGFLTPIGIGGFSWVLDAPSLRVNWTREKYVEFTRPPDFSQQYGTKWLETTSGEERLGASSANSTSRSSNSSLIAFNQTRELILEGGGATSISLQPAEGTRWTIGNESASLVRNIEIPSGLVQASTNKGESVVSGSFSLYVWQATVAVQAGGHNRSFEAGNWTEQIAPSPNGHQPVRYLYIQSLRLDVTEGKLTLSSAGRQTEWLASELCFAGALKATFSAAKGTIQNGTDIVSLDKALFEIESASSISVRNATAARGLSVHLEAPPDRLGFLNTEPPVVHGDGPTLAKPSSLAATTKIGAGIIALGSVAFVAVMTNRARTAPRIDDVEVALFIGKQARARKLAKAILRRDPKNTDVIFLYATAFLVDERPDALLHVIEPMALRIAPAQRQSVAFLLAVAARATGDPNRAVKWATEAAREPMLREQLQRTGEWPGVPGHGMPPGADRMPYHQ